MIITTEHARSIVGPNQKGYCAKGMRLFAKRYNLDFAKFCRDGIDEQVLLDTGDAMALAVVEEAHRRG